MGVISAVVLFLGKILIAAGGTITCWLLVIRDDDIHYIAIPILVSEISPKFRGKLTLYRSSR